MIRHFFAAVLSLVALTATISAADPVPTFNKDIAPVVFERCSGCHRPGQGGPFSLLTFRDLEKRGGLIRHVVDTKLMPPWKAEPGDYAFRGDRRLTDAQIDLLKRWIDGGMPEGQASDLPPAPKFDSEWPLGKPDLVVEMPEAFTVPAEGPDIYRNFVLPIQLNEERYVKALDFRPGAPSVVHHSLFYADASGGARKMDAADPAPGFGGGMRGVFLARFGDIDPLQRLMQMGKGPLPFPKLKPGDPIRPPAPPALPSFNSGVLGGWAVGKQAHFLPDGLAYPLPAKSDLLLSTHFHPSGKEEKEKSKVGLYFAKEKPEKRFAPIQLPPLFSAFKGIDIPPGAEEYTIEDEFTVPIDCKAFLATGHAHYLGKTMKMTATHPDGTMKTILSIPDWDFAWQEQYEFAQFVPLPAGTKLHVRITYDNTEENLSNPSNPPVRVRFGEESTDEMGSITIQVVADREEELPLVEAGVREHFREALFKANPAELIRLRQRDRK
jgi:mono/diheme cytochrome c family protein